MKTTKEVFDSHLAAFGRRDLAEIAKDFHKDAVYINTMGVVITGVDKIMEVYRKYFKSQEEGTTSSITKLFIEGEIVYLEWVSDSPKTNIPDGVDTFVIRDGLIQAQTAKFTITAK